MSEDSGKAYVLTPEGWKPAPMIAYEAANPPLWAKPLLWLFNRWHEHREKVKEGKHE